MDDYNISSLQESNNEWVSRLISILTPCIIDGCKSLYQEAYTLCVDNDEHDKYLMTFQNFLSRVPKWNPEIVEREVTRIRDNSGCDYLEDLITCVHVIQLKALTCIRVGMKHRAIDLDIPKLDLFVHKVYIQVARKLYTNVYLFEEEIPPLQIQRNNRELEMVIKECILEAVRESVPVEKILRAYLDETVEENVETVITTVEPEKVECEEEPKSVDGEGVQVGGADTPVNIEVPRPPVDDVSTPMENAPLALSMQIDELVEPKTSMGSPESPTKSLTFSNIDQAQNPDNTVANILAPKDVTTLERISDENQAKRLLEEEDYEDYEDDEDKIQIMAGDANISLDVTPL